MAIMLEPKFTNFEEQKLPRTAVYPRLRYMGSKYKIIPYLSSILSNIPFESALDAFAGSGVVAYSLKEMGKQVVANDFLHFSSTIARAVIENPGVILSGEDLQLLLSPNKDGRNFIQSTFENLYFPLEDHQFLDSVWSHAEGLPMYKRELALSALCLAAARKQPRGVFTITDLRYDDGRRNLHLPLRELFVQAVKEYNNAVFDNGKANGVMCADVFSIDPSGFDLVYFDPPYAPPKDDADYIKRYHFLEGLSRYWRDVKIMENTKTKKSRSGIHHLLTNGRYVRPCVNCLLDFSTVLLFCHIVPTRFRVRKKFMNYYVRQKGMLRFILCRIPIRLVHM
ncbi:DNA adenine methylase [Effusibacillus consociatus]|uniref:site-specific DNA-methyltransferase (adenine-specific) n=1 Tax=Effusibacillus consociatus TaxID=1117041 RepID=A0ABV9Q328_9BACL